MIVFTEHADDNNAFRRQFSRSPHVGKEIGYGNRRTLESLAIDAGSHFIGETPDVHKYRIYARPFATLSSEKEGDKTNHPHSIFLLNYNELITYSAPRFLVPEAANVPQDGQSDEAVFVAAKDTIVQDATRIIRATSDVRMNLNEVRFQGGSHVADSIYTILEKGTLRFTGAASLGLVLGIIAKPFLQTDSHLFTPSSLLQGVAAGAGIFGAIELARLYEKRQVTENAKKTIEEALNPGEGRTYTALHIGVDALPRLLSAYGAEE